MSIQIECDYCDSCITEEDGNIGIFFAEEKLVKKAQEEGWELGKPQPKPLCPRCADSNGTMVYVFFVVSRGDDNAASMTEAFYDREQARVFCESLEEGSLAMVVEGRRINVHAPATEKNQ